jgi:hypothetical protein
MSTDGRRLSRLPRRAPRPVVRSAEGAPDACTQMIVEGAAKNAAEVRRREHALGEQDRLAREQAIVHGKAVEKRGVTERQERALEEEGVPEAEELAAEESRASYAVRDVEWPAYYGTPTLTGLPLDAQRCILSATPAAAARALTVSRGLRDQAEHVMLGALCSVPISLKEVAAYVQHAKPASFSWGAIPAAAPAVSAAYHASREDADLTGLLMYVAYTSRLEPRTRGVAVGKLRYDLPAPGDRVFERDTAEALLRGTYEPGMLLDPVTLVAVLARRVSCAKKEARFAEIRSYPIFEQWFATTLELQSTEALAYLAAVLGEPDIVEDRLARCQEARKPCRDEMLHLIEEVRNKRWRR